MSANIISVCNNKGGCTKTTTAICLADAFTHLDYKVLLIDLDPQGNSTSTYSADNEEHYTIADVLSKNCKASEAIQETLMGDIIPASTILNAKEQEYYGMKSRENLLKRQLKDVAEIYDIIVIDTPPNLGIYTNNALAASNGVLIPVKADKYTMDGLGVILNEINEIQESVNEDLQIYGVLLNIYDQRRKLDKDAWSALREVGESAGFRVFRNPVRVCQDIPNVQALADSYDENDNIIPVNRSLFDRYPSSTAAQDYVELVKELLEIMGGDE